MQLDEAALFLLRRINMISSRDTFKDVPLTELTTAREIAEALDQGKYAQAEPLFQHPDTVKSKESYTA